MPETFPGIRLPADPPSESAPRQSPYVPGAYWRDEHGDWRGVTPNGLVVWLKNHHVEEHADGTITVGPAPWGANSIAAGNGTGNKTWHGFIIKGVWRTC